MRLRATLLALLIPASILIMAPPADAATGKVVAFITELQELRTWDDPTGCKQLPPGTHIIINETTSPVTIYGDPFCVVPLEPVATIAPNHGTHVSAIGSFRA